MNDQDQQSKDPIQRHYDDAFDPQSGHDRESLQDRESNPEESDTPQGTTTPGGLSRAEGNAAADPGWFKGEQGAAVSKGGKGTGKQGPAKGARNLFNRGRGFVGKHKWKILAATAGAGLPLGMLLLVQLGSLLFPNLTEHIDSSRLKRITRQFTDNTHVIVNTKVMLASTDNEKYRQALQEYQDDGNGLMSKINKWRPEKVAENLLLDMDFNFGEEKRIPGTNITRQKLESITVQGKTIKIPTNTTGVVGKVRHPITYYREVTQYKADIKAALTTDSKMRNIMIRGDASKIVRERLGGVKMYRWTKADIEEAEDKPVDTEKIAIDETRRSYKIATNEGEEPRKGLDGATGDVEDAAKEALGKQEKCMEDDKCVEAVIEQGDGLSPDINPTLKKKFDPSALKKAYRTLGTTYEISEVMCLVYTASAKASRAVIDANSTQAVRTYFAMTSAADAQRYTHLNENDKRVQSALTGGYAEQLNSDEGTAYDSIPERRANGRVADTSESPSPQASAGGTVGSDPLASIMPATAVSAFASVADPFCGVMLNPWSAGAIIIIDLGASFIPGVGQAAKAGGTITAKTVSSMVVKQFGQSLKNAFTKKELAKFGGTEAATDLAGALAHGITLNRIGSNFNGAAQGPALINQADAGATVFGNELNRTAMAGVPLSTSDVVAANKLDDEFLMAQLEGQSTYQRYFAISNPFSLANRMATTLHGTMKLQSLTSILNNAARALNPMNILSSLASISSARAFADDTNPLATKDYNIVQWGWTVDEDAAFNSNPEYAPFYNEKILKQSGQYQALMDKYGKCWEGTMGNLLADGDIQRGGNGEVAADQGLCNQKNMGDSGQPADDKLDFASPEAEMVFRLRVFIRHNTTIDQLAKFETVTEDE